MIINLYNTTDEVKKVIKNLTALGDIEGTAKEPLTVQEATEILVTKSNNVDNANYCFIPDFQRYYYISKKEVIRNGLVKLTLVCDVLMSFKSSLLNLKVVAERSESNYSSYLVDSAKSSYNFPMVLTRQFPNGFGGLNYYLTVAGGGDIE